MSIFINPGSGPVAGADFENAAANMTVFCADCSAGDLEFFARPGEPDAGRYSFLVWQRDSTRAHHVEMPGIPLDRVRYMGREDQNIWDYPRLYVDGSSWVWKYALLNDDEFVEPES